MWYLQMIKPHQPLWLVGLFFWFYGWVMWVRSFVGKPHDNGSTYRRLSDYSNCIYTVRFEAVATT